MSNCRAGILLLFSLLSFCSQKSHSQTPDYSGNSGHPDTSSSFILIGDVQLRGLPEIFLGRENNKKAVETLLAEIAREDPTFVLILGDLTFSGSSLKEWKVLDAMSKPIISAGIPVFPLPGNHEYLGNHNTAFQEYFSRFPQLGNRLWYSKRWKDIGIITLDANLSHFKKEQSDDERAWYLSELQSMQNDTSLTFIIVCTHQPPFTNSTVVSDDNQVQKYFVPAFINTPKAKLFFSGHSHSYEHFKIKGKDFIVSGGGGPRQDLRKGPKDARHKDYFSGGIRRSHHFCKVTRSAEGVRVQMIQVGEDLQSWSIGEEMLVMP
ncbi:MAG: metallophosphoesterase [Ignavibacteriota bacterium]